ncbi:MAG: SAM-dependent methyltransferase [Gammaproteobacteria bacterium]|nr:MAG: SAM-dependent methyltransferase [Gammaproteobacteria bacterium]
MKTDINIRDAWQSANPYEYYMGRWSSLVADKFIVWLSVPSQLKFLDVGCGSGALSKAIIDKHTSADILAIDQSEGFVTMTQERLGSHVQCKVDNALSLFLDDDSVNVAVSGLVLNFIPRPDKVIAELKRVTSTGGSIGVYVWDYTEKMEFLTQFWNVAVELNPKASNLHEANRFPEFTGEGLEKLFEKAGLNNIETAPIDIDTTFKSFDDYWKPFLGGQGPAPSYVATLERVEIEKLRDTLKDRLPIQTDGSIPMAARAWAAKGIV